MIERKKEVYDDFAKQLWDMTGVDWHVELNLTLTEPVCATIDIFPDNGKHGLPMALGYIGTGDANESIARACGHMITKLDKFYAEYPEKRRSAPMKEWKKRP